MNIIKFKDKIIDDPEVIAEPEKRNFFNKYLKGKYAYWIHMRYAVPFESLTDYDYVNVEEDIKELKKESLDTYNYELVMRDYVDVEETDLINNSSIFKDKNNSIPDQSITLDELKGFRTWLAEDLLVYYNGSNYDEKELQVLQYYARLMYDDVVKLLSPDYFGNPSIEEIFKNDKHCACGCCGEYDLSTLYNSTLNVCNPQYIYQQNIYKKMVDMFSDLNFWLRTNKIGQVIIPQSFFMEFKLYIDNIIKVGLPLHKSDFVSTFVDCTCNIIDETDKYTDILKRLSISLEYIINNDIEGHKNYMYNALHDWSSLLYEQMYWK